MKGGKKMKYIYIKKVYNHNTTPLIIGNKYTIKKDDRFTDSYKILNYGLIINSYTLNNCFKLVGK